MGTGNVVVPMSILNGDTTGNGSVNASDVNQVKAQSGNATTGGNFRTDLNVSGNRQCLGCQHREVQIRHGIALSRVNQEYLTSGHWQR